MVELGTCLFCGFVGAGIAILLQRGALNKYFDLVEILWTNDLKRIHDRIDALIAREERRKQH